MPGAPKLKPQESAPPATRVAKRPAANTTMEEEKPPDHDELHQNTCMEEAADHAVAGADPEQAADAVGGAEEHVDVSSQPPMLPNVWL